MLQIQKYYLFPLYYSLLANEALLTLVTTYTSMPLTVSTVKVEQIIKVSTGGKPAVVLQVEYGRCIIGLDW